MHACLNIYWFIFCVDFFGMFATVSNYICISNTWAMGIICSQTGWRLPKASCRPTFRPVLLRSVQPASGPRIACLEMLMPPMSPLMTWNGTNLWYWPSTICRQWVSCLYSWNYGIHSHTFNWFHAHELIKQAQYPLYSSLAVVTWHRWVALSASCPRWVHHWIPRKGVPQPWPRMWSQSQSWTVRSGQEQMGKHRAYGWTSQLVSIYSLYSSWMEKSCTSW